MGRRPTRMVRLDVSTVERLEHYRADLERMADQGRMTMPMGVGPGRDEATLDQLIRHLLDGVQQHRQRALLQKTRRRRRRETEASAAEIATLAQEQIDRMG